ncbi:hypothetical protein ACXA45_06530 [Neomicrococcus lactis]
MPFPNLEFIDSESVRDLGQFLARARSINDDGVILQTVGTALATYVPLLSVGNFGLQLLGKNDDAASAGEQPTDAMLLLGMRVSRLARDHESQIGVYSIGDITDRTARLDDPVSAGAAPVIPAPPAEKVASWARHVPPRSGWELVAEFSSEEIEEHASQAIEAVAKALPANPGGAVVQTVRERIWTSRLEQTSLALGAAIAMKTLGFLTPGEPVRHTRTGAWQRLSASKGHVLVFAR